jgi:acyl-CoA thioesterase-1
MKSANAAGQVSNSPILVLGDSISAEYGLPRGSGWVALMTKKLGDDQPVVNASISGETTAGGRSRIKSLVNKHKPSILILELGGNDALRGLDLNATESNLITIANQAKSVGAKVLVLGMQVPPNYGAAYSERFEQMYETVANKVNGQLVANWMSPIAVSLDYFQPDGIHPTKAAQSILLDSMWKGLQALLKAP